MSCSWCTDGRTTTISRLRSKVFCPVNIFGPGANEEAHPRVDGVGEGLNDSPSCATGNIETHNEIMRTYSAQKSVLCNTCVDAAQSNTKPSELVDGVEAPPLVRRNLCSSRPRASNLVLPRISVASQRGQLDINRFFIDLCSVSCVLDWVCFKVSCERQTVAFLCIFPLLSSLLPPSHSPPSEKKKKKPSSGVLVAY